jgi:hypothetical protein
MEMTLGSVDASRFWKGYYSARECTRAISKKLYARAIAGWIHSSQVLSLYTPLLPAAQFEANSASEACGRGQGRNWLRSLESHERSVRSQGGQDGILAEVFSHIGTTNRFFVEVGFNTEGFEQGSNTYYWHEQGWNGVMFDAAHGPNTSIGLVRAFLTPETITAELKDAGVPPEPDYVSIDIDSQDLWLLRALLAPDSGYRPRVVTVEYNAHFPIGAMYTLRPGRAYGWDGFDLAYGAAAGALRRVAESAGYRVVYLVGHLDMVLVRGDILDALQLPKGCEIPYASFSLRGGTELHHCVTDPERRGLWLDYDRFESSGGDVPESLRAATESFHLNSFADGGHHLSAACLGFHGL